MPSPAHRSPCPVSCTLDFLGDRWSLLVVRDLFFGRSRFKDFLASPEKIPTNVLAERLQRLLSQKLVEQIASPDGTKHKAYALTPKGQSLRPIIKSLRDWGLEWIEGTEERLK
jgi:DNA-binding HxlR family transcriptional regulator